MESAAGDIVSHGPDWRQKVKSGVEKFGGEEGEVETVLRNKRRAGFLASAFDNGSDCDGSKL